MLEPDVESLREVEAVVGAHLKSYGFDLPEASARIDQLILSENDLCASVARILQGVSMRLLEVCVPPPRLRSTDAVAPLVMILKNPFAPPKSSGLMNKWCPPRR